MEINTNKSNGAKNKKYKYRSQNRYKFLSRLNLEINEVKELIIMYQDDKFRLQVMTFFLNYYLNIVKFIENEIKKDYKIERYFNHKKLLESHTFNKPFKYRQKLLDKWNLKNNEEKAKYNNSFNNWLNWLNNLNRKNKNKKRASVSQCLKGSKSFDCVDQSFNDGSQMIYLHKGRRFGHCTSIDNAKLIIEMVFNHVVPITSLKLDTTRIKIRIMCPSLQELRDNNNKFISHPNQNSINSTKKCAKTIDIIELIRRLEHYLLKSEKSILLSKLNSFIKIEKRKYYMKQNNYVDCIFCIHDENTIDLPNYAFGSIINYYNFKDIPQLFRMSLNDVRICSTCSKIWCVNCKVIFYSSNDKISHDGLNCEQYQELKLLNFNDSNVDELIVNSSIKCPNCKTPIHKIEACNHIKCSICQTDFCYMCGKNIINELYDHFNKNICRLY
jgi:LSD1 subclass zinc finger protein